MSDAAEHGEWVHHSTEKAALHRMTRSKTRTARMCVSCTKKRNSQNTKNIKNQECISCMTSAQKQQTQQNCVVTNHQTSIELSLYARVRREKGIA
jgi:hypothetical protein